MNRKFGRRTLGVAVVACAGGLAAYASPALAGQQMLPATCTNGNTVSTYLVSAPVDHANANGGWGTAQVLQVLSGTPAGAGTPTMTSGVVEDTTLGQTLATFTNIKGNGNANQNQSTVSCTVVETGTVGEFAPGAPNPGDSASLTLNITVVTKP